MSGTSNSTAKDELGAVVNDLFDLPRRIGAGLARAVSAATLPTGKSCCDIPEPCWMPQPMGDVDGFACAGATATLRIRITNCDQTPAVFHAAASGPVGGLVEIQPRDLPLGPKERGRILFTFKVPAGAHDGEEFEAILWLQGCKAYFLRWTITAGKQNSECCHEIEVHDCRDLVHHWYDHFYCDRPCPPQMKYWRKDG